MDITIIVIGDELLIGQVIDTNSGMIARTIAPAGWQVRSVETVGDNPAAIRQAVENAMNRTDIVITTGGLGPTKDDITKNVLAEIFGGTMIEDKEVLQNVEDIVEQRHIQLNELTRRQAIVPSSCTVIQNLVGTAPVMWFEKNNKVLVSLPGVPHEASVTFRSEVFPRLFEKFGKGKIIEHRVIQIWGVIESEIASRLEEFENELPSELHLAYLPQGGLVRLRLDGISENKDQLKVLMDDAQKKIEDEFGRHVLWIGPESLPEILLKIMKERGYTVSTAESCTGGKIAHIITSVPGASEIFIGSVVAYHNNIKQQLLGVQESSIKEYGAVSLPVAEQMANGVSTLMNTHCAIATSGIAGPGGATPNKPVGTVCLAVKTPSGTFVDHFHFAGDRERIIQRASTAGLVKLIAALQGLLDD